MSVIHTEESQAWVCPKCGKPAYYSNVSWTWELSCAHHVDTKPVQARVVTTYYQDEGGAPS